jgi:hypothetical protein
MAIFVDKRNHALALFQLLSLSRRQTVLQRGRQRVAMRASRVAILQNLLKLSQKAAREDFSAAVIAMPNILWQNKFLMRLAEERRAAFDAG